MLRIIYPTVMFTIVALSVGVVGYEYLYPEADLGNYPQIGENIFMFFSYAVAAIGLVQVLGSDVPNLNRKPNTRQKVFMWLWVILALAMVAFGYWFTAICLVFGVFMSTLIQMSSKKKNTDG